MSFASFSSPLTIPQIWPTVRSQRALIREAHWSPVHSFTLPGGRHGFRRTMAMVGLPRFDGQGWWLGQATWSMTSFLVASNSLGVI
jgi:hypothetical protein